MTDIELLGRAADAHRDEDLPPRTLADAHHRGGNERSASRVLAAIRTATATRQWAELLGLAVDGILTSLRRLDAAMAAQRLAVATPCVFQPVLAVTRGRSSPTA